jgi:hypothetical protein
MNSQAVNTTEMTMIRPNNLVLFKIPTFNLFIVTSRKHVGMFVANSKACRESTLLVLTQFTITANTIKYLYLWLLTSYLFDVTC